jgi:hypothetical protein
MLPTLIGAGLMMVPGLQVLALDILGLVLVQLKL